VEILFEDAPCSPVSITDTELVETPWLLWYYAVTPKVASVAGVAFENKDLDPPQEIELSVRGWSFQIESDGAVGFIGRESGADLSGTRIGFLQIKSDAPNEYALGPWFYVDGGGSFVKDETPTVFFSDLIVQNPFIERINSASIGLIWEVCNIGTAATGQFELGIFTADLLDVYLVSVSLSAGECRYQRWVLNAPLGVPGIAEIYVDPDDLVEEETESNNSSGIIPYV
jgi:hypothetical protein